MTATSAEIPIWVSGKQLWISGVDRKTTVNDVVEALLGRPDKQYSITEKWRQVERPLNGETRILKLWKSWGDAKTEVKLSLKKIDDEHDCGRNSSINNPKRKSRYKSACNKYGQTVHPKRLAQLSKSHSIERMLKLILMQGETIQHQISRMNERDLQIEEIEGEQHKSRINVLGTNYLLDAYLKAGTSEEKEDSGVVTECAPSSENNGTPTGEDSKDDEITIEEDIETEIEELRDKIRLLERVVKINKKLEKEEENLVRLFINIERCKKSDDLMDELKSDLNKLRNENVKGETELKNNFKLLTKLENVLKSRKKYLQQLHKDFHEETSQYRNDEISSHTLTADYENEVMTSLHSITNYTLPYCAINKPVLNTLV